MISMSRLNNLNKFSSCKPIPRKQIWTVSLLLLQKIRRGPLTLLLWTEFGRKSSSDSPYCVYDACRHNNRADPVFRLSTTKLTHSKRNILFSHRHSCFSAVRILECYDPGILESYDPAALKDKGYPRVLRSGSPQGSPRGI